MTTVDFVYRCLPVAVASRWWLGVALNAHDSGPSCGMWWRWSI